MRHLNIWVSGKVQGVFYRRFIVDQAQQLGVKGLVKNLPDGRVYIEAEGKTDQLKVFETFCLAGSPASAVKQITKQEGSIQGFDDFRICS